MGLRNNQIKTLIKKNFIYKKKDKKKFFLELSNFFFITFFLVFELRLIPNVLKKNEKGENPEQQINLTEAKDINLGFIKNGNIGYVVTNKNSNLINTVMDNILFKESNITFIPFENEEKMEYHYLNYKNSLMAGIVFDSSDLMSYTIRIDGSLIPDPSVPKKDVNSLLVNDNTTNYLSVFSPLQLAIDQAIIQLKTGDNSLKLITNIGKLPQIYREEKTVVAKFDYVSIFLVSILFIFPLLSVVKIIVSEKERKIKSFLMVIGMHPSSFWISWFLSNTIYLFTMTIIMGIVLTIFRVFSFGVLLMFIITNCLYSLSLVNFTLLFTTFFTNPRTANSIANIMFVLFTSTYIVFNWGSMLVKYIAGVFFSPVSYGIIIEKIIFYEKSSTFSFLSFFKDKVVLISLIILIWDILFYFQLALIFDLHFSEENESFLSWKKSYKSKRKAYKGYRTSPYSGDMEEYNGYEVNKLDIRNVSKKFKDYGKKFLALNDVSFKAYQNEIFCILGHKGSGKTTLIKILTGLISPDKGLIMYEDIKLHKNKQEIREKMGVCNQENILFDLLSVEENINVFSDLKSVKDNTQEILTKIGLWKKKDTQVENLNGGEKRKLCIGIALLGNPRYIILDEPTSGLDPVSKRNVWKLLSSIKKNRFILMTTHYMDEADILSDRKLILSNGIVRCLGTSVYLKNHFEMMYHLNIKTADPNSAQHIILNYVPDAVFDQTCLNRPQPQLQQEESINELVYTWKLPIQSTPLFKDLFKALNSRDNHHIIRKYGIKSPSLEELYIKLTENESTEEREINKNGEVESPNQGNGTLLSRNRRSYSKLPDPSPRHKMGSFKKLLRLIQIRFKIYSRNFMFILNSILVPTLLAVILFIVLKFVSNKDLIQFKKNEISYSLYPSERWNFDTKESNLPNDIYTKFISEENIEYDNVWSFNNYTFSPLKNRSFFASVTGVNDLEKNFTFFVYYNETKLHSVPVVINLDSNLLLNYKGINSKISVKSHPFPYYNILDGQMIINGIGMSIGMILVVSIIKYGALVVKERKELIVKQLRLNGVSNKIYWFSVLFTDFIFCIVMGILIFGVAVLCKYAPFLNKYVISILAVTLVICTIGTLLFQYCLSFLFDNATTAYSYFPTINIILVMISYFVNSILSISNVDKGLLAVYSKSSIIIEAILTLIYPPYGIIAVINFVSWVKTLNNIDQNQYKLTLENYISFDHGIPIILIAATIAIFIYMFILIKLDKKYNHTKFKYRGISSNIITSNEKLLSSQEQDDVYNEYILVKTRASNLPISTINLHKSFKNKSKEKLEGQYKTVLDNITFHVDPKECFGLLGPNGVGKSTTLNILTKSLNPDYGNVCYEGFSLKELAQLQLGYCNQEDILWNDLTLREHLEFYLELRGYPKRELKDVASKYISYCDLEKHQNKKVKYLSSGTKRKLSLLIAICGYPKYIILDEPTSGMDPCTRRFVWNIIRDIKNRHQSAILMTTHSMEEAETLCDRLTILINGRLQCIGTPEYLTATYAKQFILDLETDRPNEVHEDIFQNHNSLFSKVEYHMEKETDTRYKYYIEKKYQVGRLFKENMQKK